MGDVEGKISRLAAALPDSDAALRFLSELESRFPSDSKRLLKNEGLLLDILTVAAYSPLLSTTILQNPEYIWWVERRRTDTRPRSKDELLESLARFIAASADVSLDVALSRFRRRELLRIFLLDVKRLMTISETTEDISNLADTILEFSLGESVAKLERRYGMPVVTDESGRFKRADFSVISFGKLGSRELNYSSDIDLLFMYSADGETRGGDVGSVTNKEFFIKVSEAIVKMVGNPSGEGAAYRVDLRLRPHGRVGPISVSLQECVSYYSSEARPWERQVLIRSRCSAGSDSLFKAFSDATLEHVYPRNRVPTDALRDVRLSKEKIDKEQASATGFNVKLGIGGIREIEFIAQALQLAHGISDRWVRNPHTLIALSRLRDRGFLSDLEFSSLSAAYNFLRQLEHILQMEHGLQTHTVPVDPTKRNLIGRRLKLLDGEALAFELQRVTGDVSTAFRRIFGDDAEIRIAIPPEDEELPDSSVIGTAGTEGDDLSQRHSLNLSIEILKRIGPLAAQHRTPHLVRALSSFAPHFARELLNKPSLLPSSIGAEGSIESLELRLNDAMRDSVAASDDFSERIASLRRVWAPLHFEIVSSESLGLIDFHEAKRLQTVLAEASIEAALKISFEQVSKRSVESIAETGLAVLGLGKLGGRGIDYGSDLDLVLVFDNELESPIGGITSFEAYSKIAELFVVALSSLTRDGQLYRVDLRLRPDGRNGLNVSAANSILDYFNERAAIWEWLAYMKVRSVAGSRKLGGCVERGIRDAIFQRASQMGSVNLAEETLKIRERLQVERCKDLSRNMLDIKFGVGGLLDIYFASRFLQLVKGIDEIGSDRSTSAMLDRLLTECPNLSASLSVMASGYEVLSRIDHTLRLNQGRSTRFNPSNQQLRASLDRVLPSDFRDDFPYPLIELMNSVRTAFQNTLSSSEALSFKGTETTL